MFSVAEPFFFFFFDLGFTALSRIFHLYPADQNHFSSHHVQTRKSRTILAILVQELKRNISAKLF